ncbi:MAG TPA: SAM-dependent methyltransferase [Terriglobales bacterium]|nr:SAM-dependent methyltransferase [Terriglobales bacterium]
MTLREYIENEIRQSGPIPFSRFMQLCLYGETASPPGYYSGQREQFGKSGDFYTSSDVHAVYGRLLARQFEQMWRVLEKPTEIAVIELGPGRGFFAQDVLAWVRKKYPDFAAALSYRMVETSGALRFRLGERFGEDPKVSIHSGIEEAFDASPEHVIVFANEFFDALPTEVLDHRGELRIGMDNGKFVERFVSPTEPVKNFVTKYGVAPEPGERVDAPLVAQRYASDIASMMQARRGFGVFVDYGYVQSEMLAGRHLGTVTSFRQHTISDSPYEAPGEQDITVHVNFTAIADAFRSRKVEPLAWVTQAQFLMGVGEESQFAEAFEECKLPQEQTKRALQLKHLIAPEGMGESFHVLVVAANLDKEKAARLDGLKFVRPSNQI